MRWSALLVLAACGHAASPTAPSNSRPATESAPCVLPADWDLTEMVKVGFDGAPVPPPAHVRVLTWNEVADDRPLYIDSAILWIETAAHSYEVVHLYRHPKDKTDTVWHQSMIYDRRGFEASHSYPRPPTRPELDAFLHATAFQWSWEPDYKLLGSGMCPQQWQDSFGQAPWHAYPALAGE